jgi:hypothetical protein
MRTACDSGWPCDRRLYELRAGALHRHAIKVETCSRYCTDDRGGGGSARSEVFEEGHVGNAKLEGWDVGLALSAQLAQHRVGVVCDVLEPGYPLPEFGPMLFQSVWMWSVHEAEMDRKDVR